MANPGVLADPSADVDDLHREYARTRSPALSEQLINHYQPLAKALARRMSARSRDNEDVSQVALMGLVKALNRFDVDRGVKFGTFAWRTIEGELKRYFRDTSWTVHVPRSLQERALLVSGAIDDLGHALQHSPTVEEVARRVNLTDDEVVEVYELRQACQQLPLDAKDNDSERDGPRLELGDDDPHYVLTDERQFLADLIRTLPERERKIVQMRFIEELTQSQIAERTGLSQMHVSRLLARSLASLRQRTRNID